MGYICVCEICNRGFISWAEDILVLTAYDGTNMQARTIIKKKTKNEVIFTNDIIIANDKFQSYVRCADCVSVLYSMLCILVCVIYF